MLILKVLLLLAGLQAAESAIYIQLVTLTQTSQSFTFPFPAAFSSTPSFNYYIESGFVSSSEFNIAHNPALTQVSLTRVVVSFDISIASWPAGDHLSVTLLVTDQNSQMINFGRVPLNLTDRSLTFSGFLLSYPGGTLQIYPLCLPMMYTRALNGALNGLLLTFTVSPPSYFQQGVTFFSYIYITNVYAARRVATILPYLNQVTYGYLLNYAKFNYQPSSDNSMIALRAYVSTSSTLLQLNTYKDYTGISQPVDNFIIGYLNIVGGGVTYEGDVFIFNTTEGGCGDYQFNYYTHYFDNLPLSCKPCHSTCKTCVVPEISLSSNTYSNSCLSCGYLRAYQPSNDYYGSCPCYRGLAVDANGECLPCEQACLTFQVVLMESTNDTKFLLYYSYPDVVEHLPLEEHLVITINQVTTPYNLTQKRNGIFVLSLSLGVMAVCEANPCNFLFLMLHPQLVVKADDSQCMTHNNVSILITDYVSYDIILPEQVRTTFKVLGMMVAGSYIGGYTSLLKILFQLEQMIDFHKYLNLTLPVIFNQLVEDVSNFKFMDLTTLLPDVVLDTITNFPPNDLDQLGPPRLIYYDEGVNFIKNSISAIISCIFMLMVNYLLYLVMRMLPLKATHKLARKITKRKIITVHDTLEQLVLPIFFYAMSQMMFVLVRTELVWVYGAAFILAIGVVVLPFLVSLYIFSQGGRQDHVEVYQDLMQDNNLCLVITFVYYVFNYYRKVIFALCLASNLPGLVQIYLLITLNVFHLAFQLYLIVAKVYRSKSKVVIRLINSISIITVEVLILIYNLSDYDNQINVNIGMVCFYLSITTAVLGIIDAIIKLFDTILQQVGRKKVNPEKELFPSKPIQKDFRNEIICRIGEEIGPKPTQPKDIKFKQDKELMEHTFHPEEQPSDSERNSQADATKPKLHNIDLVFIDDDWTELFPPARTVESPEVVLGLKKEPQPVRRAAVEVYEIPEQINKKAKNVSRRRGQSLRRKQSKYDVVQDEHISGMVVSKKRDELQVNSISESLQQISEFDPNNP